MLSAPPTLSPRDFKRIGEAVYQHCGINLHEGKQELVQARLAKLMRRSGMGRVPDYLDHVLANPASAEFAEFIDALSTNLTSFFREPDHFAFLADHLLPDLLDRKLAARQTTLRAWSAACSSGEEPYSIAMVLRDRLEAAGHNITAKILATDISHRVLQVAQAGVYDRQRVAPVPPMLRGRYLVPSPAGPGLLSPADVIRRMVRFAYLNLMEPWPFTGPFDFIFCRNVMIYFDKPTQQRLIDRFFDVLDAGGVLFTGHSESLTGITHRFRYLQPTIYQKP